MRITWFGNRCFRINFSALSLVFFANEADADVLNSALVGGAKLIDDNNVGPFLPMSDQTSSFAGARLIDAMDQPETFLRDNNTYVMDALRDERLVVWFLDTSVVSQCEIWFGGAVVLIVGEFEQCLAMIGKCDLRQIRQLVLAISDIQNVDIAGLLEKSAGTPIQLLETGLALEL